ncbi:MAG: 50S ribosomal protein L24e [Thermoprotei archaeon]|jgi:large subunit ribosomal protein L24e
MVYKCSFCGKNIIPGTGTVFVKTDGTILRFCSSKCKKNYFMGRDPRKYKWTLRYIKHAQQQAKVTETPQSATQTKT